MSSQTPLNPAAKKSLLQEILERNAEAVREAARRQDDVLKVHVTSWKRDRETQVTNEDVAVVDRLANSAGYASTADWMKSIPALYGPNTTHDAIVAARDVTIRGQGEVIAKLAGQLRAEQAVSSERLASMIELGGRLSSMADDAGRVKAEKEALVRELEALRPVRPEPASSAPWGKRHDGRGGSAPE